MPPRFRPQAALRASQTILLRTPGAGPTAARALSRTAMRREASHDSHYDPPSGWLWGVKPGDKPQKEGWEGLFLYGFYGALGLAVVAYAWKPDTNIETWALEEAKRRLQAEGTLPEDDE